MASRVTSSADRKPRRLALYAPVACLLACISLASCEQSEKTRQVIDQRAEEAKQSLDSAQKVPHTLNYDPLTVTNKVWGGNTATRMQRGMPLPPNFEARHGITLVSADAMSLSDIASAISAQTGIPVRLSSLQLATPAKPVAQPAPLGIPGIPNSLSQSPTSVPASGPEMPISYEGPLSGLLDRMGAYFAVSWRYDGSAINISRYETRIFAIEALPGTTEVNEGMQDDSSSSSGGGGSSSGGSGGSGGSSGSTQNTTNTITQNSKAVIEFKYWEELKEVLTSIVANSGSVVVSPTMGTVTVTSTPEVMETVSDYLSKENKRLSRQIAINVQIYSVNLTQSEDFNIAFTAFLRNLSKFSGLNYSSAAAPGIASPLVAAAEAGGTSPFGTLGLAILNSPNDPTAHVGDVFQALSTIGDTTQVAQFPMTTLNNHPVSRRVGTDTAYISSVTQNTNTSTTTGVSPTIVTPTTSTIHSGFSLQVTPRLLDDGRILLQYSMSLIGLDSLGQTVFSGEPLDLPVTDNRIFVQQSLLRSGQTLMIGGVDQENLTQNKNGVLSPDNFLLGGGVSSNNDHLMLFMAITPQVMDLAGEEHG